MRRARSPATRRRLHAEMVNASSGQRWRRILRMGIVASVAFVALETIFQGLWLSLPSPERQVDLDVFYTAVQAVLAHGDPYAQHPSRIDLANDRTMVGLNPPISL